MKTPKIIVGLLVLPLLFAPMSFARASTLTQSQISAVIGLLKAFNVDQSVVNSVEAQLNKGNVQVSTPTPIINPNQPIIITIPAESPAPQVTQSIMTIAQSAPVTKARIDVKVQSSIKADGSDTAIFQVFVYDTTGKINGTQTLHVETNDKAGFNRPGGYTDGQSPTVTSYDITGTADTTRDVNKKIIPVYIVSYSTTNVDDHTFTFSTPDATQTVTISAN